MFTPTHACTFASTLLATTVALAEPPASSGAAASPAADAHTSPGDHAALLRRLAELEAKSARDDARITELAGRLASVEASERDAWMSQQRADEIRAIVYDALADADTRASMLQGAAAAGYDDGFFVSSADGNWLLRTNMLMQQRLVLNRQSESPGDKSRWGFENSRTKFILSGHLVSPDWFYLAEIELGGVNAGFPNGESRTGLGDAYAGYDFGQGWRIQVGTFKAPLLREELVSAANQLAVERSLVNYVYTGGRTDGIQVDYRNDRFHFAGSYNNGINDLVYGGGVMTGGTSPIFTGTADFGFTFRGEWLMQGSWDSMNMLTSPRGTGRSMMLGGALHWQSADSAATSAPDLDLLVLTVDFTALCGGTSVYAALIYANADLDPGTGVDAVGFVIQAGHYFTDVWEAFVRYEWSDTDTLAADDISILTLGFNRYLAGFNAKWSTDFGIGLDTVPFAAPITGWRTDLPGEDSQFVVRSQLQILF